ncbi:MAG: YifB family Mg chelatase-like AAA ATPase [Opitutales bacterium]|nr:YifB family Mg chelatase-like AAA ATPase [Opitutales bacterium]
MSLAITQSGTLQGIDAFPVDVEVNSGQKGDPKLIIVGLPDAAVKESCDRVISALSNSGFIPPETRMTINLAPGHIRKEGPLYDLPIALTVLAATGQIRQQAACELSNYLIAGELSLSGETRPIKGGLSLAVLARDLEKKGLLLPPQTATEASLVEGIDVYEVTSLSQAIQFLNGQEALTPLESPLNDGTLCSDMAITEMDFSEIKGQHSVRRAVEVAVAGAHNILIIGPPGSGKSMIAKRIPTIMPQPSLEEYLEILRIYSVAGKTLEKGSISFQRPFRSPHHTISDVGLLGGGAIPSPGEISLSHNGVLFLDELPEFKRNTLEVLRQPLEDGEVTISRSAGKITLPSAFMLVAAMNPTPSGYSSKDGRQNMCSAAQIQRYRSRISGPLLDRIDIHVEAPSVRFEDLRNEQNGENSNVIRERIQVARAIQKERFSKLGISSNARMGRKHIVAYCEIDHNKATLLQQAMEQLKLSARAYDRILKVARTIADLAESKEIEIPHLLEAIQYRNLDRALFH